MATREAIELVKAGNKTGVATGGQTTYYKWENRYGLRAAIWTLKCWAGGTATGATLGLRIQGAPVDSASLYTMLRAYTAGVGTMASPLAKTLTFAAVTTAGSQWRYSEIIPRRVRVVEVMNGSAPQFNYSLWLDGSTG